jgi:hypothetical protein
MVAKLVPYRARLLRQLSGFESIHLPKKYKMVEISEGMASTLKPAQNIYKKDLFNPVSHQIKQLK